MQVRTAARGEAVDQISHDRHDVMLNIQLDVSRAEQLQHIAAHPLVLSALQDDEISASALDFNERFIGVGIGMSEQLFVDQHVAAQIVAEHDPATEPCHPS